MIPSRHDHTVATYSAVSSVAVVDVCTCGSYGSWVVLKCMLVHVVLRVRHVACPLDRGIVGLQRYVGMTVTC